MGMLFTLKDIFYRYRQFYYGSSEKTDAVARSDAGEASEYVAELRALRGNLSVSVASLPADALPMLSRLCDLMIAALVAKNYRFAGALADAGIRLCGVYGFPYLSRARFFEQVLIPLRAEFGDGLFAEEQELFLQAPPLRMALRPAFHRERSEGHYYTADRDEEFRAAHPVLYGLFLGLGTLLFLGSVALYLLLTCVWLPVSSWFLLFGLLGAALCGTALISLCMSFIHQYMGHRATAILAILGLLLCVLPYFI